MEHMTHMQLECSLYGLIVHRLENENYSFTHHDKIIEFGTIRIFVTIYLDFYLVILS